MKTIAVVARKGGVGKSCLARTLAVAGLMRHCRTAIIDADQQQSTVLWSKRRQGNAPAVLSEAIPVSLGKLERAGAELVLVDLPPHAMPLINQAIEAATSALIVTTPFPDDLEQVGPIVQIVQALKKPASIVLNKCPPKSAALEMAKAALATFGLPILPPITSLIAHPYASASGLVAQEYEKGRASYECMRLYDGLMSLGQVPDDGTQQ